MKSRSSLSVAALSLAVLGCIPTHSSAAPVIRSVGGDATPASITAARDQFRLDLGGGTTAGSAGSFGGLRREINWDGVPDGFSAPNSLPGNFFNVNSPRGAVFSTPGTGFQVSANSGVAPINFSNIDPNYSSTFGVFSAQRLFTAAGSIVTDVNFFIPGTTTAATVAGFGAVFTDVDISFFTSIEYFNELNASLGSFSVPAGAVPTASLSFLGVSFNAGEKVSRVRITTGNTPLGPGVIDGNGPTFAAGKTDGVTVNGGPLPVDLVVMDDFIYSEPVPEPSGICLFAMGITGLLTARKRNRRNSR